jgi:hypothetical protein
MDRLDKENQKMNVLVNLVYVHIDKNVYIKSKDIICPECNESCRIGVENYKIKLYDCINNHINVINVKDFQEKQKINISNIICEECNIKNKGNTYNNEFYKCLTCNKNICLLCKNKHVSNHNLINYEQKNYICQKHNGFFNKYCKQCKCNLCYSCNEETLYVVSMEDCLVCPNREVKKFDDEFECYLKCPSKHPMRYSKLYEKETCHDCFTRIVDFDEEECSKCPNREYVDGKCVLK